MMLCKRHLLFKQGYFGISMLNFRGGGEVFFSKKCDVAWLVLSFKTG